MVVIKKADTYYEAVAKPRLPSSAVNISAKTPERGASTRSIFVRAPFSPIENEFIDPLAEELLPRSRQYKMRFAESRVSHEALGPQSEFVEDMERSKVLFVDSVSDSVVIMPSDDATKRFVAAEKDMSCSNCTKEHN